MREAPPANDTRRARTRQHRAGLEERQAWGERAAPARHAILRVSPEGFSEALERRPSLKAQPIVAEWAMSGRPLIARRRDPLDEAGRIPAGLPLPQAYGKQRIALTLDPSAISAVEPPPALEACVDFAPTAWGATIEAVCERARPLGVEARVFGSLAWSSLTGLAYLSASSDLDLLFLIAPQTDVLDLLAGLESLAAAAPMRLDGEILRMDCGLAVNWRELLGGEAKILVKSREAVILQSRDTFIHPAPGSAHARVAP